MTISYEWDVETLDGDGEDADIIDHNFFLSYADCLNHVKLWKDVQPHNRIVLVCDEDKNSGEHIRSWAYVENGVLPSHFQDAFDVPVRQVPQSFHSELKDHRPDTRYVWAVESEHSDGATSVLLWGTYELALNEAETAETDFKSDLNGRATSTLWKTVAGLVKVVDGVADINNMADLLGKNLSTKFGDRTTVPTCYRYEISRVHRSRAPKIVTVLAKTISNGDFFKKKNGTFPFMRFQEHARDQMGYIHAVDRQGSVSTISHNTEVVPCTVDDFINSLKNDRF